MGKITPLRFFKSWIRNTDIITEELCSNWNNCKIYTSLIQNNKSSLLQSISDDFGLKYFREYYSLDAVFYNEEDKVPKLNPNWVWLQNIKIAFEHEHDIKNTYQEISHLVITNCELRVLVTYPIGYSNDIEKDYLKLYADIISANKTLDANDTFLIIFGYQDDCKVIWQAWEYKKDNWKKMEVEKEERFLKDTKN